MKLSLLLIAALLVGFLASCGEDIETLPTDSSAVDQKRIGDLTFTLQVLDMRGKPQSEFEAGENFQFQFIVENKGDEKYELPIPWFFPIANDEFFALYRRSQESGGKGYVGKFFRMGANFRDLRPVELPSNSTTTYTIPWMIDETAVYIMPEHSGTSLDLDRKYIRTEVSPPSLKQGEYFTGFTVQYSDEDSVRLEVSFTVN